MRQHPRNIPRMIPRVRRASAKYSEQVGVKRHAGGMSGERNRL
jgi:hypothetical protein